MAIKKIDMKKMKRILNFCFIFLLILSCESDDFNEDVIEQIQAPTNVSALVTVTQDNTGLATIMPLGEGVVSFPKVCMILRLLPNL